MHTGEVHKIAVGEIDHILAENDVFIDSLRNGDDKVLSRVFPLDQCDTKESNFLLASFEHCRSEMASRKTGFSGTPWKKAR